MSKQVVVVGAGQNGRVVANILSLGGFDVVGFLDDGKQGEEVLGPVADYKKHAQEGRAFFISIGSNDVRKRLFEQFKMGGVTFVNAIHPKACVEPGVELGVNVMVGAFAYVNVNTVIGDGTFINNGCIVEHDNRVGLFSHLTPGVVTAGEATIGDRVFFGIGSTLRDRTVVADGCLIGAASNVVKDTEPDSVYYGNPAKFIKKLTS